MVIFVRSFATILIIAGLLFVSVGGYQIFKSNQAQNKSLAEAHEVIEKGRESVKDGQSTEEEPIDFKPKTGDAAGTLMIPRLDAELPIIEGTHEDELAQGVGHYKGTAYPLQNDQIVLSGHRDTVFRGMGELELGDLFIVKMPYGDFTYEIVETKIVDADDLTVIVPTAPDEVLTVTTCYPFSYVGSAPERYIITALPIDDEN